MVTKTMYVQAHLLCFTKFWLTIEHAQWIVFHAVFISYATLLFCVQNMLNPILPSSPPPPNVCFRRFLLSSSKIYWVKSSLFFIFFFILHVCVEDKCESSLAKHSLPRHKYWSDNLTKPTLKTATQIDANCAIFYQMKSLVSSPHKNALTLHCTVYSIPKK